MKRLIPTLTLLTLAASSACSAPAPMTSMAMDAPSRGPDRTVSMVASHGGRLIVKCADDAAAQRCAAACGGRWVRRCRGSNRHVIAIGGLDVEAAIDRCRHQKGCDGAEEDAEVVTAGGEVFPVDQADDAAPLTRLHAESAWAVTRGAGVKVAVLDTGIDATHPALAGRVAATANFTVESFASMDDRHGHGTFMAGVVAGAAGGPGGGGVAPEADLIVGKVLEDDGVGVTSAVTDGIVWAASSGAKVILLGLVARKPTKALQDAVDYAWSQDAVVVVAAGNDGSRTPTQPAGYGHSLAVGAANRHGHLARFSNWGPGWVDVSAPGVGVPGLMPTVAGVLGQSAQAAMDGSSVAAAFVAGEAALIRAAHPAFANGKVRKCIEETTSEPGKSQHHWLANGPVDLGLALAR